MCTIPFEATLILLLLNAHLLFAFAMVVPSKTTAFANIDSLAQRSLDLLHKSSEPRVFIGIAGGPGSGKSTLADNVCRAINKKADKCISIVIPMDGYHIPKEELKRMGEQGRIIGDPEATSGDATSYEDLMKRRGAPWTFDAESLYHDLKAAKESGVGILPTYSRDISDPVPGGVSLNTAHQIVLCEGLYLAAFKSPDWEPLKEIWDETWYIDVPEDIIKERLVRRHLKTWTEAKRQRFGEGRAGAEAKVEASDLKNMRWLHEMSKSHADLTIKNY